MTEQSSPQLGRGTILAVDDDALVLRGYERILNAAGFVVQTTLEATEALKMIADHRFDVVLSDIWMCYDDGLPRNRDGH